MKLLAIVGRSTKTTTSERVGQWFDTHRAKLRCASARLKGSSVVCTSAI
jgi:hypothetical protein